MHTFISEIKSILPESRVRFEENLEEYNYVCITSKSKILGVLKPISKDEIVKIVNIANKHKVPLYTISTGHNWGYGTFKPVKDSFILDLSMMNSIIEVNEKLGYIIVEPGVTQKQVYDYLTKNKIDLMIDPSGSSPECSLVGNAIERGFGIGRYNDHFESILSMTIVLANGDTLNTGFSHYKNSKAKYTFKYGIGPFIDGMFSQSNFGIVTQACIWLAPKPEYLETFYFKYNNYNNVGEIIEIISKLRLHETLTSPTNLLSRNRILTLVDKYPLEFQGKKVSEEKLEELEKKNNLSKWNATGALYGSLEEVKAKKKAIKKALKGKVQSLVFVSEKKIDLVYKNTKILQKPIKFFANIDIEKLMGPIRGAFSILKGKPAYVSFPTCYWRNKIETKKITNNPAKDNCGMYWFAPVLPADKKEIKLFLDVCNKMFDEWGFEMCETFTLSNGRTIECTLPILYNKDDENECIRAEEFYNKLVKEVQKNGFYQYRTGITSMKNIVSSDDVFWQTCKKIKQAVDPNNILSLGRYEIDKDIK